MLELITVSYLTYAGVQDLRTRTMGRNRVWLLAVLATLTLQIGDHRLAWSMLGALFAGVALTGLPAFRGWIGVGDFKVALFIGLALGPVIGAGVVASSILCTPLVLPFVRHAATRGSAAHLAAVNQRTVPMVTVMLTVVLLWILSASAFGWA